MDHPLGILIPMNMRDGWCLSASDLPFAPRLRLSRLLKKTGSWALCS